MGRPRKSPEQKRDAHTTVMLTARERTELEAQAGAYGITLSDLMRRRLLGRSLPAPAIEQRSRAVLATALLRLGINLNQVAHHMNAGRSAPPFLPDLLADIRDHVQRLAQDDAGRDRDG